MSDNDYEFVIVSDSDSEYEFIIDSDSDSDIDSDNLIQDLYGVQDINIKDNGCVNDKIENYYEFTEEDYNDNTILCIDIGVINLGIAALTYDCNFKFKNVVGVGLLDITDFHHPERVCSENCGLQHTKTFTDWMEHIFLTYKDAFEKSDKIIVERQPPGGFNAIEQLIFFKYREKTELVSPNSMHKFFDIGRFNYDRRKECVTKFAKTLLKNQKVFEDFQMPERKHDMADAICLGYYWLNFQKQIIKEEERRMKALEIQMKYMNNKIHNYDDYLQQFKYIGNCRRNYIRI